MVYRISTDFSALEDLHSISFRLGTRSLLQKLRGQPIKQHWLDDCYLSALTDGISWPDFTEFSGLYVISERFRSFLLNSCIVPERAYQFFEPNWTTSTAKPLEIGYSILNLLDFRPDALISHSNQLGVNRHGQFDGRSLTVVSAKLAEECDHLVRLSAVIVVAVKDFASKMRGENFSGLALLPIDFREDNAQ